MQALWAEAEINRARLTGTVEDLRTQMADTATPESQNGAMRLIWREQNGPIVVPPTRRGFGHTVLERMATSLGGEVSFEFPPEGVRWALAIDAAHIVR